VIHLFSLLKQTVRFDPREKLKKVRATLEGIEYSTVARVPCGALELNGVDKTLNEIVS